jgi:hypothetical protein
MRRAFSGRVSVDTFLRMPRLLLAGDVRPELVGGVIYEETSRTLFCGDLFTHLGNGPALTESDIVGPALAAEDIFYDTSLGPSIAPTVRGLADLAPRSLALMHGSSFAGDTATALNDLATTHEKRLRAAMAEIPDETAGTSEVIQHASP